MITLRPISLRCLAAGGCARSALLLLALALSDCKFDTTPATVVRDDDTGSPTNWMPSSITRRNRIISEQTRQADAEISSDGATPDDAGTREPAAADGGRRIADAGKPAQSSSAPSSAGAAGSAPAMVTMEARDGSVPKPECMPGIYEGTFEGPVTFAVGSINTVTGTVRAELVPEPTGNSLQVRNGTMTGKDSTGVGMSSTWTGRLNCGTKQLENAQQMGGWQNGSTFTGTLEGTYSAQPDSLSGTWMVQSEQIPLAGGNGAWRMSLAP